MLLSQAVDYPGRTLPGHLSGVTIGLLLRGRTEAFCWEHPGLAALRKTQLPGPTWQPWLWDQGTQIPWCNSPHCKVEPWSG